jgi:hypothetical protein
VAIVQIVAFEEIGQMAKTVGMVGLQIAVSDESGEAVIVGTVEID